MHESKDVAARTTALDRALAWPMFGLTVVFLVGLAAALHTSDKELWRIYGRGLGWWLAALYVVYPLEALAHWLGGGKGLRQNLLFCLVPVARLGGRDHVGQTETWLPWIGWQTVSRPFTHRLIRYFSLPMIVIALLVVPVIAFELFFDQLLRAHPRLNLWVEATSAFIWSCFVLEFVVVISASERRWDYCRQNWINVAVIVLPAIACLRVLQIGRLLGLNQVMRTARVFRLRGLLFRAWRALIALEVVDKLLRRDPALRLRRCQRLVAEKEEELATLRREAARLEMIVTLTARDGQQLGRASVESPSREPIVDNPD